MYLCSPDTTLSILLDSSSSDCRNLFAGLVILLAYKTVSIFLNLGRLNKSAARIPTTLIQINGILALVDEAVKSYIEWNIPLRGLSENLAEVISRMSWATPIRD